MNKIKSEIKIIHLSDLHFRKDWEEDQEVVLMAFFEDLNEQIKNIEKSNIYLVFSGDIVHSGGNSELYDLFLNKFDSELNKIGITKSNRFCVPGNHDVSRNIISDSIFDHEAIIKQNLNETDFNNYFKKPAQFFIDKFSNYCSFESKFAEFGVGENICGNGWSINEDISIYCMNTAMFSSGGIQFKEQIIDDKARLPVDTRSLNKWIQGDKSKVKILVMHHPIDWLSDWAQKEIKTILGGKFSLCLSGHVHDQSMYHFLNNESSLIECSAPPLLTNKKGDLGYSIITINQNGVSEIEYRQWTKHRTFRAGVNFSNTENGKIGLQKSKKPNEKIALNTSFDTISRYYDNQLNEALRSFTSQPLIWVDPVLSKNSNLSTTSGENIEVSEIVCNPVSTIIKAPPQFGLTCLAHHLAKKAWEETSSYWHYLDYNKCKLHEVSEEIKKNLDLLNLNIDDIACIVIDSWIGNDKNSMKLLKKVNSLFKEIPIIILQTIDDSDFFNQTKFDLEDRVFEILYLLPLTRTHLRKIVAEYNEIRHIGEEELVLSKVTSDLEALNLHRTPLNCLTLLKVSEIDFDESPVNRSEMIKRVLFLLFNMDEIPTYKERPDLKDCEYVLGRFCETLIRENEYSFTREHFIHILKSFCKDRFIELEVQVVFDVLYSNSIIVNRQNQFSFRFTYWIYYFAAHRMIQDQVFAEYIFDNRRYALFPEIIEFYTGIDRSREDALKVLIDDIEKSYAVVYENLGLPDGINPYKSAKWNPSEDGIKKIQKEISNGVLSSNLPEVIKDQYADRAYDHRKPYFQEINNILHDSSLVYLFQTIRAGSRALRNSDYVDPEIKHQLLDSISKSWEQILKVVLAVSPHLAMTGQINYHGMKIILIGEWSENFFQRFNSVLHSIPTNVVTWFSKDLFSRKMGPLLFKQISRETSDIRKHHLILLLINERPKGWKHVVEAYIEASHKNSFFLNDIFQSLLNQYQYSYASGATIHDK